MKGVSFCHMLGGLNEGNMLDRSDYIYISWVASFLANPCIYSHI
jgi:hypothetical protein